MKHSHKILQPLLVSILLLIGNSQLLIANNRVLLQKGWSALMKDDDTTAIRFFQEGLNQAYQEKDWEGMGNAQLYLGIVSYGSSLHNGLHFASLAHTSYDKLKSSHPELARQGQSKCLQLISTIKAREGKYREALALSQEALQGFDVQQDSTGYVGIIYHSLGGLYTQLHKKDSGEWYYKKAFDIRLQRKDSIYLSGSYIKMGEVAMANHELDEAARYLERGLFIADSSGNKQATVLALLATKKLYQETQPLKIDSLLNHALQIASSLTDKSFYVKVLQEQKNEYIRKGDFQNGYRINETIIACKDSLRNIEEEKLARSLEMQFDVARTEEKLKAIQQKNKINRLYSIILLLGIMGLLVVVWFYRRLHKKSTQLVVAKQNLLELTEQKKALMEKELQEEISTQENQLSTMAVRMLQKNEILGEIMEKLDQKQLLDGGIQKVIQKNQLQEREWEDFDSTFQQVNQQFYQKLKQQYPDISQGELKICALIKMKMSIKDMAGILNISPDSVKTARYRLRKKLGLQTEDNLTDFIEHLSGG